MLGERKTSLFTNVANNSPPIIKTPTKVIDSPISESAKSHVKTEFKYENRTHDMFSQLTEQWEYGDVLKAVQQHMSDNYSELLISDIADAKEQMKKYIRKFIIDKKISVADKSTDELIADIYTEMAEFGFITKYIYGKGIEEVDINSWQDIEVQYSDGRTVKLDEHFDSPEHAINVIRRIFLSLLKG